MQYTKKQHYVPQIYWNIFAGKQFYSYNTKYHQFKSCYPKGITYEEDIYEIKDKNGNYYNRNEIENELANGVDHDYGIMMPNIIEKINNANNRIEFTKEERELLDAFVTYIL